MLPYFQVLWRNHRSTFVCYSTWKSIIMHFPFLLCTSTFSMQPFHTLWRREDAGIRKADGVIEKVSVSFHNELNKTRDLLSNIKPWTSELIKGGSLNYDKKNYGSYFIVSSCKFYMFILHSQINCLTVSLYLVDELVSYWQQTEFPHCISLSVSWGLMAGISSALQTWKRVKNV